MRELAVGEAARPHAVLGLPRGAVLFVDRSADPPLRLLTIDGAAAPLPADAGRQVRDPQALAADDGGRVYVLDHGGERVVRLSPALHFDQIVIDLAEWLDDPPHG